jgi:hypothetical protein
MGLDMYTLDRAGARQYGVPNAAMLDAPSFYGVNYMHDRPNEGLGVGYAALHAYATEALRFELLGQLGVDSVCSVDDKGVCTDGTDTSKAAKIGHTYGGVRPAVIYDVGWMKLKLGLEYQLRTATMQTTNSSGEKQDSSYGRTRYGAGLSVQFVVDPIVEFGANAAYGRQHETDDRGNDVCGTNTPDQQTYPNYCYDTVTLGGFANLRLGNLWLAGAGANWTAQYDAHKVAEDALGDYTAHLQGFVALQYLVAGQLFVKAVVGFSRADFQASDQNVRVWSNYMYSGRVRLMYLY